MKKVIIIFALMFLSGQAWASEVGNLPAESALQKLMQGNERFVNSKMEHPNQTQARRGDLVKSQHPFAVILCCSDSRVPPEIIFDRGLGDLFVIRNAGEVDDEHVLGSVEYAVEHLGVNLVVVLGHKSCGAVGAAMTGEKDLSAIESIKKSIKPACNKCKEDHDYTYDHVIKENTRMVAKEIAKHKDLVEYTKKRGMKIVPAYYDLDTGKVEILQ